MQSGVLSGLALKVGFTRERIVAVPIDVAQQCNLTSVDDLSDIIPEWRRGDDYSGGIDSDDDEDGDPEEAAVIRAEALAEHRAQLARLVERWGRAHTAARAKYCPWYTGPSVMSALTQVCVCLC